MQPFRIAVPEADLDDLKLRLREARFPDQIAGTGWSFGTDTAYLRELCEYWLHSYDWRAHEARINQYDQFITTIQNQNVHFLHVRSPKADALPLILTHGWPGSIVEFLDCIDLLRPNFHLVIPSLPGYGFSGPTHEPGWNVRRIATAWTELMARLGYTRYGAQGGDWGSMISRHLADIDRDHVCSVHVNMWTGRPPGNPDDTEGLTARELAHLARSAEYMKSGSGYVAIQSTKPQTLAYGLNDSPAGLLGWIVEKFYEWTDNNGHVEDAVSRDALLTNIAVYWFTGTAGSSARLYYESITSGAVSPPPLTHLPVGIGDYPAEIMVMPRRWAEADNNIVYWKEHEHGGHFAAMEEPAAFAADVTEFFTRYR